MTIFVSTDEFRNQSPQNQTADPLLDALRRLEEAEEAYAREIRSRSANESYASDWEDEVSARTWGPIYDEIVADLDAGILHTTTYQGALAALERVLSNADLTAVNYDLVSEAVRFLRRAL